MAPQSTQVSQPAEAHSELLLWAHSEAVPAVQLLSQGLSAERTIPCYLLNRCGQSFEQLHISREGRKSLILATLDVRALHPSIPHGVGIAMALQQAIPTDPPVSPNHSLMSMLKTMLKLILTGNTFRFAGKTFKQIKGIAMGTPVDPILANLFMGN